MQNSITYDALVLGGGPGGSTTATFLARAGHKVLLLEKERFPRFHIGESLLPYNRQLFEEMGVLSKLNAAGFTRKCGAQFHLGNGSKSLCLVFRNGRFTREPLAFQVERAKFDEILLQHARACGADVWEGWTAAKVSSTRESARVVARGPDGHERVFAGAFVIDATGRANLTGNQEGLREVHPHLKKLALFGHFSGVARDAGDKGGDTIIVRLENQWFWLIPLAPDKVSVGCVLDQAEFAHAKESPEDLFNRLCRSSPPLYERMKDAAPLGPLQTTGDFSYHNRRLIGPRLIRVGDAAGFMDPIFSAGVFLAMHTGRLAAQVVAQSLASGDDGQRRMRSYEKRVGRAMQTYWRMVDGFYRMAFLEVFMEPRPRLDLPAAVTAVLAGELEGGWRLWWRLRLFFALTRLQSWCPIVPRITFAPNPVPEETSAGWPA